MWFFSKKEDEPTPEEIFLKERNNLISNKIRDIRINFNNIKEYLNILEKSNDDLGHFIDGLETNSNDDYGKSGWWPFK